MPNNPKAFISHATEDKTRFVAPFALALRKAGIDAWIDEWEIQAGDSLVQKIFEEGIRNASVVIVVLSETSVTKKWVREELDAAIIARINKTTRLIPVVIEDCEIPTALQAVKWIRFTGDLTTVVDEIVRIVFGSSAKPPIGAPPVFATTSLPSLPGLDRIDAVVLFAAGEVYFEKGHRHVDKEAIIAKVKSQGVGESQIDESLEMLASHGYLVGRHAIGRKFIFVELSMGGAELTLQSRFPNLEAHVQTVVRALVNESLLANDTIAAKHSLPLVLVDFILDRLKANGSIRMSESIGGGRHVFEVSVPLKRSLRT